MYELLGISIAFAGLLTLNAAVTLGAAALWRGLLARRAAGWPAATRAGVIFALRALPLLSASGCVLMLLLPAYVTHEPRHTSEELSVKLLVLAFISAVGVALAFVRGVSSWAATRRLVVDWLRHAEPISLRGVRIPAYRIRHKFPLIAVVGIRRPRLFVASQVCDSLTEGELVAAIAHESGHLRACDNLKRAVLRACHDALSIVPCGRSLDRAWAQAAEAAADEHAARAGRRAALDLAAALVKIARMIPAGARPAMPAGAYFNGESDEGLEWRVRRLIHVAATGVVETGETIAVRGLTWTSLSVLLAAGIVVATTPEALEAVHGVIEHAVAALN